MKMSLEQSTDSPFSPDSENGVKDRKDDEQTLSEQISTFSLTGNTPKPFCFKGSYHWRMGSQAPCSTAETISLRLGKFGFFSNSTTRKSLKYLFSTSLQNSQKKKKMKK